MRRPIIFALYAATIVLLVAGPAGAQNPSADDIIRSLRPTGPSGTTRGIRLLGPSEAPAAAPAPGAAPTPGRGHPSGTHRVSAQAVPHTAPASGAASQPDNAAAPSVNLTVEFATGSANLTPAATHTLDELGRALTSSTLSGYRYRIEGHTDTVGTHESNLALSQQRAAKVLEYLAAKWGVDRAKVETVGLGDTQLLVPTGPNVPQPRNRRVTVINLGA